MLVKSKGYCFTLHRKGRLPLEKSVIDILLSYNAASLCCEVSMLYFGPIVMNVFTDFIIYDTMVVGAT